MTASAPTRGWPVLKKERLLAMKQAGHSDREIGEALDKSTAAVSVQWSAMRKTDPRARAVPKARRNLQPGARRAKRNNWGEPMATVPAGEVTSYVEDGRTITVLPPGYARGASPVQVTMPRGGAV